MLIMSWDHSRDFLSAHKVASHGSERWSGPLSTYDNNAAVFFQRWISHFCAPGFFFTMGIGMYFMARSRLEKYKWTQGAVIQHFFIRGFLLLVVGRLVDMAIIPELVIIAAHNQTLFPTNPKHHSSSPFHGPEWLAPFLGIFEVMTALGLTMIIVGALVPTLISIERRYTSFVAQGLALLLGIASVGASTFYILQAQGGDPCGAVCRNSSAIVIFPRFSASANTMNEIFLRFFLYPGAFAYGNIIYPLVPWCSVTFVGYAAGVLFKKDARVAYKWTGIFGVLFLLLFLLLRFFGGAEGGNFRGWPRDGEGSLVPWIAFLTVCKYPPSLSYLLLTLGGNWCLLSLIEKIVRPSLSGGSSVASNSSCTQCGIMLERVLLVFGQVPLFFYTIHFWCLGCLGFFVRMVTPGLAIEYVVLPWIVMVGCLYFPCVWWREKKRNASPESWVKML